MAVALQNLFQKAGSKTNFLQGKFESKNTLREFQNPGDTRIHGLIPEVYNKWIEMLTAFEKEKSPNYKQTMFIVSSFRNYKHQKAIWESKYTGSKPMREPIKGKTPKEIIDLILEFSSAPGTSRHHWGTDFDINSLDNGYFEKGGKGYELYSWMTKNASRFGFCQPYNSLSLRNGVGYHEEKWHWSYRPLASELRNLWIQEFKSGNIKMSDYKGSDVLGDRALDYVSSVALECQ
ncbi:M15 family metallopeptidase [Leptospira sp. GIMC2001]|uniref:M15 family metallopeptidase n=1 Tax=Leptospira sp. GIMC2001 TaxID=1513297 RepID=UPI003FA5F9FB